MFRLSKLSYKTQRKILITSFLFIPLLLLTVFSYLPSINMIYYSFTDWNGFSKHKDIIGLENYITIFTNPDYFKVFFVSLYYLVGSFLQLGLALYFATILSAKVRLKSFFKGVLFFPYLLNGVAIGFIFLFFFRPDGSLDSLMKLLGLGNFTQLWMGNPKLINVSFTFTSLWRYMGYNFVLFLGAIQSIPGDIYEAADLDGANKWHQFKYIIFPSIKPIIELNMILAVKGAISVFEIPYIMADGGNGSATFVIQTVNSAFKYNRYGLASAMGVVLLIIIVIVTLIQKAVFKEREA
ncbi:MAG: carbohydrate ABC transporter permease [Clostridiaceae bacterium]